MLKDILIKTAEILNRDDLVNELSNNLSPSNCNFQNDIMRLISYYNYTITSLYENYFTITRSEYIKSDKNKRINYYDFSLEPKKIISIKQNGFSTYFCEFSTYASVPSAQTQYEVTYKYIPDPITDLTQKISFTNGLNEKMVCYGIASEFFACKSMFKEAQFYNDKYMFEIFKSKTTRDRRIKSNFYL